jgi:hypothetical protein
VGADQLADVIVAALAGEDISAIVETGTITRQDLCSDRVHAIFEGRRLPFTEAQARENAVRASERAARRAHRSRRRHWGGPA